MTKTWLGATNTAQVSLTTTQVGMTFLATADEPDQDVTLLRSRGQVWVTATPDAAGDFVVAAFGLIVVHGNALTAGGASLPGPIENIDADWLWHQFVHLDAVSVSASDGQSIGLNARIEIDSKAMRRVPRTHVVVLMAELSGSAMASVTAAGAFRLLFGE